MNNYDFTLDTTDFGLLRNKLRVFVRTIKEKEEVLTIVFSVSEWVYVATLHDVPFILDDEVMLKHITCNLLASKCLFYKKSFNRKSMGKVFESLDTTGSILGTWCFKNEAAYHYYYSRFNKLEKKINYNYTDFL